MTARSKAQLDMDRETRDTLASALYELDQLVPTSKVREQEIAIIRAELEAELILIETRFPKPKHDQGSLF